MKQLLRSTQFYILSVSIFYSSAINLFIVLTIPSEQLQSIRLSQIYGLSAFAALYLAMVMEPLGMKSKSSKAQQALIVSTMYFAALHGFIGFFGLLGGFSGLSFLTSTYVTALVASGTAFCILILLVISFFFRILKGLKESLRNKIQLFLYVSGMLILYHAVLLGTHFADLSSAIPKVIFLAVSFLVFIDSMRLDRWIQMKWQSEQRFGFVSLIACVIIALGCFFFFTPLAKNSVSPVMQSHSTQTTGMNMQSMQGDKNLRFNVDFDAPENMQPNSDVSLSFSVQNADNAGDIFLFQKIYEKESHLVIVDSSLNYFMHLHPKREGNKFVVTTQFPKPGVYRAYFTYQPAGATEQQMAFRFTVGDGDEENVKASDQQIDTETTKTFGQYSVSLDAEKVRSAAAINNGTGQLRFTIINASTKKPVTTLKPYLGAFGHLIMIHEGTYSYIHAHPTIQITQPNQIAGPDVTFIPMSLSGPVKPGVYKIFAEFNPDGNYTVADYKIWVY